MAELIDVLRTSTLCLAGDFAWNMLRGGDASRDGVRLGAGSASPVNLAPVAHEGRGVTEVSRSIPTFTCLFRLAVLLPAETPLGFGPALRISG